MTRLTAPTTSPQGCVSPRIITAAEAGRALCDMAPSQRSYWLSCAIGFLPKDEAKALIDEITGKEMG